LIDAMISNNPLLTVSTLIIVEDPEGKAAMLGARGQVRVKAGSLNST